MSSTTLLRNQLQKTKLGYLEYFLNLQGKIQNDRKKQVSELEKIRLGKGHGLQNTQTYSNGNQKAIETDRLHSFFKVYQQYLSMTKQESNKYMHRPVVQKGVMKSEDNSFKMKDLSVFFSYMFKVKEKKIRRLQETP